MKTVVVAPESTLELLSIDEMEWLRRQAQGDEHDLLRRCALAVLNCGIEMDDADAMLAKHRDFDIQVDWHTKGLRFELTNPPARAFVDGEMIRGVRENLTAVVRDLIYSQRLLHEADNTSVTVQIFRLLRNAKALIPGKAPHLAVCWGGHSISTEEYQYTKEVGYELGLRGLNICTGCGPGAMKGPMKGATIAHAKQRIDDGLYLGLTEPGIIASEAPNPIVSKLVILPDIEKRLEAFVRVGHGFVIFPGGVGTVEEILYLLGILLHPGNRDLPLPIVFTGPSGSEAYFSQLDAFIKNTLGAEAGNRYQIIVGNPTKVAKVIKEGIRAVHHYRLHRHAAFHFNWELKIDPLWQMPFEVNHASMRNLDLNENQPAHQLAVQLRRLFSGIVTGNVKPQGVALIARHGPFEIRGSHKLLDPIDQLLRSFIEQKRMVLPTRDYRPCYKLVRQ